MVKIIANTYLILSLLLRRIRLSSSSVNQDQNLTSDHLNFNDPSINGGSFFLFQYIQIFIYSLIWLVGSIGGVLVIYVIIFNSKLKTITNTYLLNLAIADLIFLQGIPFYLTSLVNREWIFSLFTCKLYWTFTGVNQFTAIFILTLLAFDRFLAVCRPNSINIRKITSSKKVSLSLWFVSIIFMLPIILYSSIETISFESRYESSHHHQTPLNNSISNFLVNVSSENVKSFKSCTILWPENSLIQLEIAFIFYGCLFSFFIPIILISIFSISIVFRLKKNRKKLNMGGSSKGNRKKATFLVLFVIAIYITTYTPFWIFQITLLTSYILNHNNINYQSNHQVSAIISSFFQLLVYLNSSLNPFLYAFISETFRTSFKEAIKCSNNITLIRQCFYEFSIKFNDKNSNRQSLRNRKRMCKSRTISINSKHESSPPGLINKEEEFL